MTTKRTPFRGILEMVLAVGLLLICSAAPAEETNGRVTPFQLPEKELIAKELYAGDQAVARASSLHGKSNNDLKNVAPAGWLAVKAGKSWNTRLIGVGESGIEVLFEVYFPEGTGFEGEIIPVERLSPVEEAFLSSFALVKDNLFKCSRHFVSITLSGEDFGLNKELVYFLASPSSPEEIVFGGHFLVAGSPAKNPTPSVAFFSNSCLSLDRPPEESSGLYVTHLLTDEPTEIHLFLSLKHEIPIYVGTKSGTWKVESGNAKLIETR